MQKFSFGHSSTKVKIIFMVQSYGTYFGMIYNTGNTSLRKMFRQDRRSHCYLTEPVGNTQYIKTVFLKRFTNFTEKLSCSTKIVTKSVFSATKNDFRSTTSMNLRTTIKAESVKQQQRTWERYHIKQLHQRTSREFA